MASTTSKVVTKKLRNNDKTALGAIGKDEPDYDVEQRLEYIATAAYYKAVSRGFAPGEELDDWLQAEAEFDKGEAP